VLYTVGAIAFSLGRGVFSRHGVLCRICTFDWHQDWWPDSLRISWYFADLGANSS